MIVLFLAGFIFVLCCIIRGICVGDDPSIEEHKKSHEEALKEMRKTAVRFGPTGYRTVGRSFENEGYRPLRRIIGSH